MHAAFASPSPIRVGSYAPLARPARGRSRSVAVRSARRDAPAAESDKRHRREAKHPVPRRDALLGAAAGVFGIAAGLAVDPRAALAAQPPPTPDASNSKYIQGLLAKTEANKDLRQVELQNKNCLRQSRMGVGDCAGLPEEELVAAMDESVKRMQARKAKEAEEERKLAEQVEAYERAEAEKAATAATAAAAAAVEE